MLNLRPGGQHCGVSGCRLPGCRDERKRRSANLQSIFLYSIVRAGPVGETAHSEQQLVYGWFYRECSLKECHLAIDPLKLMGAV